MWKVYLLSNAALDEYFVGVTDGDPHAGLREVANGEFEVVDHWDAEEHRITLDQVDEYPTQEAAVAAAKVLIASKKALTTLA